MRKYLFISLMCCSTILFGQDVSQSIAVDAANQYYERVKNDNLTENISKIKATNQVRGGRIPELISPLGLAEMWLVPVEGLTRHYSYEEHYPFYFIKDHLGNTSTYRRRTTASGEVLSPKGHDYFLSLKGTIISSSNRL